MLSRPGESYHYLAHAGLPIQTGFEAHDGSRQIESWTPVVLVPLEQAEYFTAIAEKAWEIFKSQNLTLGQRFIGHEGVLTIGWSCATMGS
jgi:hypothetical protein